MSSLGAVLSGRSDKINKKPPQSPRIFWQKSLEGNYYKYYYNTCNNDPQGENRGKKEGA
jgi:hypothetical protein